jgi:hypothetical protein
MQSFFGKYDLDFLILHIGKDGYFNYIGLVPIINIYFLKFKNNIQHF